MCDRLVELREGMASYAADFDASRLDVRLAEEVVRLAAAIEAVAATLKALAAARLATVNSAKGGQRSVAHQLARVAGTSVAEARETMETGRRLEGLPELAGAVRSGQLSSRQSTAVADAAAADPRVEERLVELARRSSLAELREECARTKAAACPPEARRQAIHAARCLRAYTDAEGAWNLRMRHNPEVGAQIMAALEPIRDRLFREARASDRREPLEAYGADALVELTTGPAGEARGGGRAKIIVRVDLPALLRGRPTQGEVCELAGYGPLAASAVRDLLDTGDPFLAAVVTNGERVVGVAHLGRRPTAHQQTALEWLYPTCAAEGCGTVAFLEVDHRVDWSRSHLTVFDLLDRLCSHHHDLKTREGWGLVHGRGKRAFVPPDDPRHPRHAHDPPAP